MSAPRSIESIERSIRMSQSPVVRTSKPVSAVGVVLEFPYVGRFYGAVQIYTPDNSAFVATFRIEGTLMDVGANTDGFLTASVDNDYFAVGSDVTARGLVQLPFGSAFSRIRVRCTSYTSGSPIVKAL